MEVFLRILMISCTWIFIQIFSGWLAHKVTPRGLSVLSRILKIGTYEQKGRIYQRLFHIKSWKDSLPEAGAFFAGGIAKNRLISSDYDTLNIYYHETLRAEFSHWLPFVFSWTFFLWNTPDIAIWMPPVGLLGNLPFLLIQRYNRARVEQMHNYAFVHSCKTNDKS